MSYPPKSGYPVRRGVALQLLFLEYWIARTSRAMTPSMTSGFALLNDWHVHGHVARRGAVEARIVGDLDLPPERAKAGALVERQRGRMIEAAGVQPEPLDRPRPRKLERAVHQEAADAGADEFCRDTEHADLAGVRLTEIELEQAFVAVVGDEGVGFDQRVMEPGGEFFVGSADAREPQPLLADAAIEIAIPGEIGPLDVP